MRLIGRATATSLGFALFTVSSLGASAQAPVSPTPDAAAINSGGQSQVAATPTLSECWTSWLSNQHLPGGKRLTLGSNQRQEGGPLFVARGTFPVRGEKGTAAWLPSRSAAFTQAELAARRDMAEYIAAEVRSSRSASMFKGGADQPPPDLDAVATQLSNADKLATLTGLALDDAIRNFDPKWNGAGLTDQQKRQQAVTIRNETTERIAARSAVFASGAFTAMQCEGPDEEGAYSVQVGLLWSNKLAKIAEAVYDPRVTLPPETPESPLAEQFAALTSSSADWMAFAQGARVWTNEQGERVVVGFGVASGSSVRAADHAQARLQALAAIQRFVGEKVVTGSTSREEFADQETASGQRRTFDSSVFRQRIDAESKQVKLSGVAEVGDWRGKHPWGGTMMQVVALSWTPSSSAAAQNLGTALQAAEQRAARQGRLPDATDSGGSPAVAPSPSAAPVRSGPSSKASSY